MKKIVLAVALVLCFYSGFVIWSINEYNTYCNNAFQFYKKIGFETYFDPIPFMGFWYGKTALGLGAVLLALICGGLLLKRNARKQAIGKGGVHMKERISSKKNPLVGVILGFGFILVGIARIVVYGSSEPGGYIFIISGLATIVYCAIIMERQKALRKIVPALMIFLTLSLCISAAVNSLSRG